MYPQSYYHHKLCPSTQVFQTFLQTFVVAQMLLAPTSATVISQQARCPLGAQAPRLRLAQFQHQALTEKAAIRKMHQLGIKMAEVSQPPHLENDDWELWSDESQATAIKVWIAQRERICQKINELSQALPSLRFSHSFASTGVGPVCVARTSPSHDSRDDMRIQLYEVMPPDIADIIENDPLSQSHFDALPRLTLHHLQVLFPDPAEAEAILQARRLNEILENMGYSWWGMPYSASSNQMQQQHEPLLAELSHLEKTFPHLDLSILVARINTSLTRDDYGYSACSAQPRI